MARHLPRRFQLVREVDTTGVSGTGIVAWGVEFPDGKAVTRWRVDGKPSQICVWDSVEDVRTVHGHGGDTRIEYID